jgi:hypothetical protein
LQCCAVLQRVLRCVATCAALCCNVCCAAALACVSGLRAFAKRRTHVARVAVHVWPTTAVVSHDGLQRSARCSNHGIATQPVALPYVRQEHNMLQQCVATRLRLCGQRRRSSRTSGWLRAVRAARGHRRPCTRSTRDRTRCRLHATPSMQQCNNAARIVPCGREAPHRDLAYCGPPRTARHWRGAVSDAQAEPTPAEGPGRAFLRRRGPSQSRRRRGPSQCRRRRTGVGLRTLRGPAGRKRGPFGLGGFLGGNGAVRRVSARAMRSSGCPVRRGCRMVPTDAVKRLATDSLG